MMLHLNVMDALADRIEAAEGWDEDPAVFLVYVLGRQVTLSPLRLPALTWHQPNGPAEGLELVAAAMARRPYPERVTKEGTLTGVAFMHEAYEVLDLDYEDVHERRRWERLVAQRRLREHPNAREIRALVAVDSNGVTYQARHVRGRVGTDRLVVMPGDTEKQPAGVIVEALDLMVEVLTGAPRQKRPDTTVHDGSLN